MPGAVRDLSAAARIWGIIAELASSGMVVLGDKGYLGKDRSRTALPRTEQARRPKRINRGHARLRAPVERY
jgi:hypothetical protein